MSAPNPAWIFFLIFFFFPVIVNSNPASKEQALGTAAGRREGLERWAVTPCDIFSFFF